MIHNILNKKDNIIKFPNKLSSVEKEIEASRYNKVNIDHLKEQIISIQKVIDKLRNGTH